MALSCCVRCFLTHILSHGREIWAAWASFRNEFAEATGYVSTIPLHSSDHQLSCTINSLSDSFSTDMLDTRLVFWLTEALQNNIMMSVLH
jgi:hypothetical protein